MSIYEEKYDIRQAIVDDIDDIMTYIRVNWKSDHILGNDREFFEYEHVFDNKVNFIIAREKDDNEIKGIIGYLYASYDKAKSDIWTVMWMVSPKVIPLLGLRLFEKARELTKARSVIGVGDNPETTVPMMKAYYRFFTGKLDHYYMLSDRDEYCIAKISYKPDCRILSDDSTLVTKCDRNTFGQLFDFDRYAERVPYKDATFFTHRYIDHPIYKYDIYVLSNDQFSALLVTREQHMNGAVALRIIDYYGDQDLIKGMKRFWEQQLEKYEYVDFYCLGIEEDILLETGFAKIKEDDENIIPDYFNPYVAENINIYCTSSCNNTIFCKGDADQDRPSQR